MVICVCKYPIMITDKRFGSSDVFLSMPLEVIGDGIEIPIPDMEVVDEVGFDNIKRKYMKVKWQEVPSVAKRYNVNEHIVMAGCQEDQLSCDTKSIFSVSHPLDEWNEIHMVELTDLKKKD